MAKKENPLEAMVEQFSEKLVEMVDAMPVEDRPFDSEELTAEEQLDQYMMMRNDPQAFMEIIEEQGMRAALEYVQAMERQISKVAREPATGG